MTLVINLSTLRSILIIQKDELPIEYTKDIPSCLNTTVYGRMLGFQKLSMIERNCVVFLSNSRYDDDLHSKVLDASIIIFGSEADKGTFISLLDMKEWYVLHKVDSCCDVWNEMRKGQISFVSPTQCQVVDQHVQWFNTRIALDYTFIHNTGEIKKKASEPLMIEDSEVAETIGDLLAKPDFLLAHLHFHRVEITTEAELPKVVLSSHARQVVAENLLACGSCQHISNFYTLIDSATVTSDEGNVILGGVPIRTYRDIARTTPVMEPTSELEYAIVDIPLQQRKPSVRRSLEFNTTYETIDENIRCTMPLWYLVKKHYGKYLVPRTSMTLKWCGYYFEEDFNILDTYPIQYKDYVTTTLHGCPISFFS